jgi:GDP-L-fucose synthase
LIRKFHEAKLNAAEQVTVWGTGTPQREFLYCDDMADACCYLMRLPEKQFDSLISEAAPPLVNIGVGKDLTIKQLAESIGDVVGFQGDLVFDSSMPDGTPRKLLDVSLLGTLGWQASTSFRDGLVLAYEDFCQREL